MWDNFPLSCNAAALNSLHLLLAQPHDILRVSQSNYCWPLKDCFFKRWHSVFTRFLLSYSPLSCVSSSSPQKLRCAPQSRPTLPLLQWPCPPLLTSTAWARTLPPARTPSVPSPLLLRGSPSPRRRTPSASRRRWPEPPRTSCWAYTTLSLRRMRMNRTAGTDWPRDQGSSSPPGNVEEGEEEEIPTLDTTLCTHDLHVITSYQQPPL